MDLTNMGCNHPYHRWTGHDEDGYCLSCGMNYLEFKTIEDEDVMEELESRVSNLEKENALLKKEIEKLKND